MSSRLTPAQREEALAPEKDYAWIWLLEIEVPTDPPSTYYFARNPSAITFGTFGDGTAKTYSPFPFDVGEIDSDTEGTIQSVAVTTSNVSREVQAALELYGGLVGQTARVMLVSAGQLDARSPLYRLDGEVISASSTADGVTLTVGQVNVQGRNFPAKRIIRDRCDHDYGRDLCGYDTTRSGALQTCDKSYDGPNGCEVHGDDEEAAAVTRLHPLRFGGFPGVPRPTGLGS